VIVDHELYRVGLRTILRAAPGCEVIGEASRDDDALDLLNELAPDLVIVDTALRGWRGTAGVQRIRRQVPAARVLVLTEARGSRNVAAALAGGANGYALKSDSVAETLNAIERVRSDRLYLSPSLDVKNDLGFQVEQANSFPDMTG
jgi:two-component system nitrate/nitrite response regulator NarL